MWCGNFHDHRRVWNCVHEIFVCSLDVNLWDKTLNIQEKTQFILIASKEVGLEVDVEKNKVHKEFMNLHQTTGQYHNI